MIVHASGAHPLGRGILVWFLDQNFYCTNKMKIQLYDESLHHDPVVDTAVNLLVEYGHGTKLHGGLVGDFYQPCCCKRGKFDVV